MEIQFNSHASISVVTSDGLIVQDPWYVGRVFNEGWALTSKAHVPDWSQVDMIWISHEHPDHLNFPTLKSIPDDCRKKITVLFQKHSSGRIADVFRKLGFEKVRELPLYKWTALPNGTELFCGSVGSMDSFLAIRDQGKTVLNLNDCVLHPAHARAICRALGQVDFLFTQFSFANWVGNDSDEVGAAARKLEQLKIQNKIFQPKWLIPFASYVYFCNEENRRMNDWANTPGRVHELGLPNVRFLYPGDRVGPDGVISEELSSNALRRYKDDYLRRTIQSTPPSVRKEDLLKSVEKRLLEYGRTKYHRKTPPLTIFVRDLNLTLVVNFAEKSVISIDGKSGQIRLEMVSQVADFFFKFPWGPSTVYISGMYFDYGTDGLHPFNRYQNWIATELFDLKSVSTWPRVANFFWKKRGEIYHRLASRA